MKIGLYGYGSIGRLLARTALSRGHEIVGVVDIDPGIIGKDAGVLAGVGEIGVRVSRDPGILGMADVVLHATSSYLDKVYTQLLEIIDMRIDIVSTCETLAYPYYRYPVLARRIQKAAWDKGVTVIGSGINPGFLLDFLPAVMAVPVDVVEKIEAVRSVDASKRRIPFQKKIGIGLSPEEFREKLDKGEITGHVGYAESIYIIADALGIELSDVKEGQEPVITDKDLVYRNNVFPAGTVIGLKGYGIGIIDEKEIIRIEFHAYLGAPEYEEIRIKGANYSISWRSTGTPGDQATAAVVLSIAEKIKEYPPGLITIADLIPFKPRIKTPTRKY